MKKYAIIVVFAVATMCVSSGCNVNPRQEYTIVIYENGHRKSTTTYSELSNYLINDDLIITFAFNKSGKEVLVQAEHKSMGSDNFVSSSVNMANGSDSIFLDLGNGRALTFEVGAKGNQREEVTKGDQRGHTTLIPPAPPPTDNGPTVNNSLK